MAPRIAVPHPTSRDLAYNRANLPAFAQAVQQAGGEPIFLDLTTSLAERTRLADSCHGFLLPGSPADVDPALYGQTLQEHTAPADPAREQTDRMLIEHACRDRKALLGICFGAQMLNVHFGGTLLQDLAILPVNHAASGAVQVAHFCTVLEGSLLGELAQEPDAGPTANPRHLPVNSSHHQAIGIAAQGFRVAARCPQDGVVEAIEPAERTAHFMLGVQWHPERTTATSQTSRNLFARLIAEAR